MEELVNRKMFQQKTDRKKNNSTQFGYADSKLSARNNILYAGPKEMEPPAANALPLPPSHWVTSKSTQHLRHILKI